MVMMFKKLIGVVAVVATIAGSAFGTDCYSHDGIEALSSKYYEGPAMVTCGNNTNTCCLKGEICGSDLLCHKTDGSVTRQYCADKNWEGCSSLCAQYDAAGVGLSVCKTSPNTYCCPGASNCCTSSDKIVIDPSNGSVLPAGSTATGTPLLWAQVTPTAVSSSSKTSSLSSSSSVSSSASGSSLVSSSVTAVTTASGAATSSSSTAVASPSNNGGLSAGAGAGIGVGCAVAAAGLATLAWLLIRERRKRRQLEKSQYPQQSWDGNQGYAGAPDLMQPYTPVPSYSQVPPQELDTSKQYHEMDAQKQPPRAVPYRELPDQHH